MTWWYRNLEIGRVDHDKNFQVHGQGPLSLLEVAPLSGKYFGDYSCRAENIHGSANHSLELVMAREPTIIQQAVLDRVGSTLSVVLQTIIGEVVQSRRRSLLGPSPG